MALPASTLLHVEQQIIAAAAPLISDAATAAAVTAGMVMGVRRAPVPATADASEFLPLFKGRVPGALLSSPQVVVEKAGGSRLYNLRLSYRWIYATSVQGSADGDAYETREAHALAHFDLWMGLFCALELALPNASGKNILQFVEGNAASTLHQTDVFLLGIEFSLILRAYEPRNFE